MAQQVGHRGAATHPVVAQVHAETREDATKKAPFVRHGVQPSAAWDRYRRQKVARGAAAT